jgi:hypothetical protein
MGVFCEEGHCTNILWRVRVGPLIIVGSGSLTSIYWIRLNTCNYSELPQIQDCRSCNTQPIITLWDRFEMNLSGWLLPKDWFTANSGLTSELNVFSLI